MNNAGLDLTTEWVIKAVPENGQTLDELEAHMKKLGNKVIRRESDGLVVIHDKKTQHLHLMEGNY